MPPIPDALARRAHELTERRESFVRATVVRAQRPTSAHAGDTALVDAAGRIDGFVGGACVEASVRYYGLRQLAAREPLLLRVVPGEPSGVTEEGAVEVRNPCLSGGAVEIFLEPWHPSPRVVVVGATPVARALAAIGDDLGFDVELTETMATPAGPRADDAALIVASHGREEEPALEAALRAGVPYVALVASPTRGAAVLSSLNVDAEQRARVFNPAGLDLGGRTPGEIAVSVFAQLVAERARLRGAGLAAGEPVPGAQSSEDGRANPEPPSAIDPVCGMTVAAVPSSLHYEFAGKTSYFCSPGCRAAFVAEPERFSLAYPHTHTLGSTVES
ncbi:MULTISPECIES: XdhC family protein [unclassified Cryobacterium]|uniref:XdhC family protein n=1 Tax=unclassified Cryobacterium TaxID=2649013 RepID=UPI002AB55A6E|nr:MULTISPECIES: XdhC family protein [unclassified Cryobacterium]MDY7543796.1 XdhC family protein [Cryobacterium sp. 5B3]MEA9997602.1 XdhC family protein [Cryobacterium sp. RTS3]MEB0264234.1 XdhC family protein [Cryobacterium sp. 10I5]MEB0275197.1 XdhC family protein [Cryobacterium sp. 5B3]